MPCTLHRLKRSILAYVRLTGLALALLIALFRPAMATNPGQWGSEALPAPNGIATFFGLTPSGDVYGLQLDTVQRVLTRSKLPVWHRDDLKTIIRSKYGLSFYALTSSNQLYHVALYDRSNSNQPFVKFVKADFLATPSKFDPGQKQTPGASGANPSAPIAFQAKTVFGCNGNLYEIQNNGNLLLSTVSGSPTNDGKTLSASTPVPVGTGWQDVNQVGCGGQIDTGTRGFHFYYDEIYGIAGNDDPYKAYKKGDLRFYMFDADRKIWHVYNAGLNYASLPAPRIVVGDQLLLTSRTAITAAKPSLVQTYSIAHSTTTSAPEMWNWSATAKDKEAGTFAGPDLHTFKTIIFDGFEIGVIP